MSQTTISRFFAPKRAREEPALAPAPREEEEEEEEKEERSAKKRRIEDIEFDEARHAEIARKIGPALRSLVAAEAQPSEASDTAAAASSSAAAARLTPLEKQVIALKKRHPDCVLAFEVGYKFEFFGPDAEVARDVLKVACFPSHSFLTAMVPAVRLSFHVRRLVQAGHRVGIVRQTEVAAVKALGDSKHKPFERALTALYTPATLVGSDLESELDVDARPNFMLCVREFPSKAAASAGRCTRLAFVATDLSTGDTVFDAMDDDSLRTALETVVSHLSPTEVLLPASASEETANAVRRLRVTAGTMITEIDSASLFATEAEAKSVLSKFFADKPQCLQAALMLSEEVLCCLATLITHVKKFSLDSVLQLTSNFRSFSTAVAMRIPAQTVRNLELFSNNSDNTERGSLFSLVANTSTAFGRRLLRRWLAAPLLDSAKINERLDAVKELVDSAGSPSSCAMSLKALIQGLPDFEHGLAHIQHRRCSPKELALLLTSFKRVCKNLPSADAIDTLQSKMLRETVEAIPDVSAVADAFLSRIDPDAAVKQSQSDGPKLGIFRSASETPEMERRSAEVGRYENEMQECLEAVREERGKPRLQFVHVAREEYLIELPNRERVPSSWVKVNNTKDVTRWRTPEIVDTLARLEKARALFSAACDQAWISLLEELSLKHYADMRAVVMQLSVLDCLFALAILATRPGFVAPTVQSGDDQRISIIEGRNPVTEALISDPYVPNSIELRDSGTSCAIVTGPNMGGKSSFTRQVALIVILAQIGSYVPAASVELTPFDAVFTRMGAADNLERGQSTFFVELAETSQILREATTRSLVVLDELGRGTATHDGLAIAYGTLVHVVQKLHSLCLFVTHYNLLAETLEAILPRSVRNYHMTFMASDAAQQQVTFLFKLAEGVAPCSFGINVARMAGLPDSVLQKAISTSHALEQQALSSGMSLSASSTLTLAAACQDGESDQASQALAARELWRYSKQKVSAKTK